MDVLHIRISVSAPVWVKDLQNEFMWYESLTIMTTVIGRFELVCLQNNSQVLIHWVSMCMQFV